MKKYFLSLLLGAAIAFSLEAAMPAGITMEPNGQLKIAGLTAGVRIYDAKWKRSGQNSIKPESGYPMMSGSIYEVKGGWQMPDSSQAFYAEEKISAVAADSVKYSMSFQNDSGIKVQSIALCLDLPAAEFSGKKIWIDEKELALPQKNEKPPELGKAKKIVIPSGGANITLEGDLKAELVDMGRSQQPFLQLRLLFAPSQGKITKTALNLNINLKVDSCMLSFKEAGSALLSGKQAQLARAGLGLAKAKERFNIGGVGFNLGELLKVTPGSVAKLRLPSSDGMKHLYLLHNADAQAKPSITMRFKDGTSHEAKLTQDIDFSVRKPLLRIPNGALAASNDQTFEGLYYSAFPIPAEGLSEISFSNPAGSWQIVAATIGGNKIPAADVNSIYYIQEDERWAPLEAIAAPEKGSVLDFSGELDAPAGKNGWIKVGADGHFYSEKLPGKQIRLWGANLDSNSLILEKDEAERLADELAACGYNTIRFHHIEKATVDRTGNDSRIFDPAKLDKMDYLFACLKKRGIYITIDLYCTRRIMEAEAKETNNVLANGNRKIKHHIRLTSEGRQNWKDYTKNFLAHVNPYTGLAWGQDPALFGIVLINEDFPYNVDESPELGPRELAGYKSFLEGKGICTPENLAARGKLYDEYINASYTEMYKDLSSFLRGEIKYDGLVSSMNLFEFFAQNYIRDNFDYVDNHAYWDHPNYSFSRQDLPRYHSQGNILKYDIWCPRRQFPARIFGKPYTLTELNYCFPNRYRASFGPVIGAYGALQNWDAMYRFDWATFREQALKMNPIQNFDIAQDSVSHMADRIVSVMYLRGDVAEAKSAVAWTYGAKAWSALKDSDRPSNLSSPEELTKLGFYCRVGSIREDREMPGMIKLDAAEPLLQQLTAAERQSLASLLKTSETKQITYDPASATFKVITPRTESLTLDSGKLEGSFLNVSGADCFQSVTVTALDKLPLTESKRMLLFHLSDVSNKHMRFSSEEMCTVESWGTATQLLRKAKLKIELNTAGRKAKVQATGFNGKPKGDCQASVVDGKLSFLADNAAFNGTMVYLIEIP